MPQDIFKSILLMENKSLSHELLPYFEYKKDTPTPSAFVQARAKIKPEGFEAVFNRFVSETTDKNEKYRYFTQHEVSVFRFRSMYQDTDTIVRHGYCSIWTAVG